MKAIYSIVIPTSSSIPSTLYFRLVFNSDDYLLFKQVHKREYAVHFVLDPVNLVDIEQSPFNPSGNTESTSLRLPLKVHWSLDELHECHDNEGNKYWQTQNFWLKWHAEGKAVQKLVDHLLSDCEKMMHDFASAIDQDNISCWEREVDIEYK